MFGFRLSSQVGPLGIDIGSRAIKMLQLQQRDDMLEVIGAAEVETSNTAQAAPIHSQAGTKRNGVSGDADDVSPESAGAAPGQGRRGDSSDHIDALADRLRAAFAAGRFTGRRCVVSLPRSDLNFQSVRLPKMADDDLQQAVIWEAAQRFGLSHDAMEVDFIRTGATLQSGENKEEIIIVACSHDAIRARLLPIIHAGFRPQAIDVGFAALARIFSRQFRREADRRHVRAIVEVGAAGTTVLMLRGDQIAFCKDLEISGNRFNEAVADHLDMDLRAASELRMARIQSSGDTCGAVAHDPSTERAVFEAVRPVMNELVKEINLCLRYFGVTFRGKPPSELILTGGDGLEPHLAETISRGCKIAVSHDDPQSTLMGLCASIRGILHRDPGPPGCWATAAGLSVRGIAAQENSFWTSATRLLMPAKSHTAAESDATPGRSEAKSRVAHAASEPAEQSKGAAA